MKKFLLVLVFVVSFVLKASTVFGVEAEAHTDASDESSTQVLKPAKSKASTIQKVEVQEKAAPVAAASSEMPIQNKPQASALGISLVPMGGVTGYQGRWNSHIRNNYTFGVALELSIIPLISLEVEAAQGRYYISYSNYGHNFTQYTYGGSAKVYLTRGLVQTYLGAGVLGITYQNMTYGMNSLSTYDRTIGAGQAIAGADLALSSQVSIGVRGSYIAPLFNRVPVMSNGRYAAPSYEEYSAMDTAMYRLMGAIKISL